MTFLIEVHANRSLNSMISGNIKRKLPADKHVDTNSKENLSGTPNPPARTKKQKLSKTPPVKPPRYMGHIANIQRCIEREYAIREGGVKLLHASSNNKQAMEASKGLFVSDAKIIGHMRELQQQQDIMSNNGKNCVSELKPCNAKLAISEIRVPLEWREFEHTKGKLDFHACGVFCLFRIGNQVMDTPVMVEVDRFVMDIILMDMVVFPEPVAPDFLLEIEVYCSLPPEESPNKPSTPIKILKKLRSRDKPVDVTFPCTTSSLSHHTSTAFSVPFTHRFALAGHAELTIKDITPSCRTFSLQRGNVVSRRGSIGVIDEPLLLPLWGQICCTLMAQPECASQVRMSGFVNIQRMLGGLPEWKRFWCVMRQHHMRCWACPEDVGKRMPEETIQLTQVTTVESAPRLSMRRPNALLLKDNSSEFYVAFESKEEKDQWMTGMNQAILDLIVWKSSCEYTIPLPQSKFTNLALSKSSSNEPT